MTPFVANGFVRLRTGARSHPWRAGVTALTVVAVAGGGYWVLGGSAGSSAAATGTTRVVSATVDTISESVSTTGTVQPADQADLNFGASGVVTAVKVAQGDRVRKGQALATIDSAALRAALAQAQASLAQAQARVASDDASSATTDTELSADQAAVTAAKGQVTSARTALHDAVLTSPITGVVATVDLAVGEQVSGSAPASGTGGSVASSGGSGSGGGSGTGNASGSGSGSGTSSVQVEVIGTSVWDVDATVDATQLSLIKKGMQARITLDGSLTPIFGTVSSIGILPSSTSTTTAYPVVVKVTGSPSGLHSGASATVALIYRQLNNVLTVPSLAVRTSAGTTAVTVVSGSEHVTTPVTTGASSGGETQIIKGLSAGEQVLVQVPARTGTTGTGSQQGSTGRFPGGGAFIPGAGTGGGNGGFGGGRGAFGGGGN